MTTRGASLTVSFFCFWALLISFRLYDIMILSSEFDHQARIIKRQQPLRGSIIDAIGNKISWSTRHISIKADKKRLPQSVLTAFTEKIAHHYPEWSQSGQIQDISAEHYRIFRTGFANEEGFHEKVTFQRHILPGIDRTFIAEVEKKYEKQLNGRELIYEYYVDHKGHVIKGSLLIIQEPQNGQNVILENLHGQ